MPPPKKTFRPRSTSPKKNDSSGRIMLLIIALLIIAYGIWFLSTHSLVTTNNRYTPIKETSNNPYFAASLLLQKEGKAAHYLKRELASAELKRIWQDTDSANKKTLILDRINDAQSSSLEDMIRWVQAGGHLVVHSQSLYVKGDDDDGEGFERYLENENPLLVELGIYNISGNTKIEYPDLDADEYKWTVDGSQKPIKLDGAIAVLRENTQGAFVADEFVKNYNATLYNHKALYESMPEEEFNKNFAALTDVQRTTLKKVLQDNPKIFLPETVMLDARLGQGRLTVLDFRGSFGNPYSSGGYYEDEETEKTKDKDSRLAKLLMMDNFYRGGVYYGEIRANDNAFLLSYLAKERSEVWFVPPFEQESLWLMMKKNLPFMIFAIAMLSLISLLALPRQFGRVEKILDDSQNNSLAYYEAIGQYLWASDYCQVQVAGNRKRLLEKIYAKTPIVHGITDTEKLCHLIAKDSHLPAEVVHEALYGEWGNEREFVAMSRAFARLAKVYL